MSNQLPVLVKGPPTALYSADIGWGSKLKLTSTVDRWRGKLVLHSTSIFVPRYVHTI